MWLAHLILPQVESYKWNSTIEMTVCGWSHREYSVKSVVKKREFSRWFTKRVWCQGTGVSNTSYVGGMIGKNCKGNYIYIFNIFQRSNTLCILPYIYFLENCPIQEHLNNKDNKRMTLSFCDIVCWTTANYTVYKGDKMLFKTGCWTWLTEVCYYWSMPSVSSYYTGRCQGDQILAQNVSEYLTEI